MNLSPVPLSRVALAAALLAGLLAAAGCAKKVTSADPNYTAPEGRLSADARLIVFPDAPITVQTWGDAEPEGPGAGDSLVSTEQVYLLGPGAIHGTIFDGTAASAYQVLRRDPNGGYRQLKDYVLNPVRRFLDSQWELYTWDDTRPSGYAPASYLGRGVVAGAVTPTSPLTNPGELAGTAIADLAYTGLTAPPDSNITMKWRPVSGAKGYWMHVYQFKGGPEERILSASPAPFVPNLTRDFFVGYVPAPADSYKIGMPGALVLTRRTLLMSIEYLVRVSAVDASGRMIATTYGVNDVVPGDKSYRRFRLGAVKVQPKRPGMPAPAAALTPVEPALAARPPGRQR